MPEPIDPKVRELAIAVLAGSASKRAKAVISALLERGAMSTDELSELGYGHPPRAVRDVKDAGVPIVTIKVRSPRNGRLMAVYSFGSAEGIQARAAGGRRQFPKKFKEQLLLDYGPADRISGAVLDPKVLQIDHRVPYAVAGDADELLSSDFMLLDASSQRAKSWACEHCPNVEPSAHDPAVCGTCFWAFPEDYEHIATQQIRRADIAWQGEEVAVYERLAKLAADRGINVSQLLKIAASKMVDRTGG